MQAQYGIESASGSQLWCWQSRNLIKLTKDDEQTHDQTPKDFRRSVVRQASIQIIANWSLNTKLQTNKIKKKAVHLVYGLSTPLQLFSSAIPEIDLKTSIHQRLNTKLLIAIQHEPLPNEKKTKSPSLNLLSTRRTLCFVLNANRS